jgi:hypothetical protein
MRILQIRSKHLITIVIFFVCVVMLSFFLLGFDENPSKGFNIEHAYKTWSLKKLYQNGKSIENDEKFANLRLKINKDGTAEWIRPENALKMSFKFINDGTQIIIDDGYTLESIETVFELSSNKLRFGKKNVASQYEYVMIPADN